jgi:hypothetical protein
MAHGHVRSDATPKIALDSRDFHREWVIFVAMSNDETIPFIDNFTRRPIMFHPEMYGYTVTKKILTMDLAVSTDFTPMSRVEASSVLEQCRDMLNTFRGHIVRAMEDKVIDWTISKMWLSNEDDTLKINDPTVQISMPPGYGYPEISEKSSDHRARLTLALASRLHEDLPILPLSNICVLFKKNDELKFERYRVTVIASVD